MGEKSGECSTECHEEKNQVEVKRAEENWKIKLVQIVIPFFISGLGMVGAGLLFGEVQVSSFNKI